jgi:hypothetical protein
VLQVLEAGLPGEGDGEAGQVQAAPRSAACSGIPALGSLAEHASQHEPIAPSGTEGGPGAARRLMVANLVLLATALGAGVTVGVDLAARRYNEALGYIIVFIFAAYAILKDLWVRRSCCFGVVVGV